MHYSSIAGDARGFHCQLSFGTGRLAEEGERIDDIRIEGSKRIAVSTVRSYMDLKSGDAATPGMIDRALKSLFATGLFADVTIRKGGPVLIVRILENPIINRIVFEGIAE